MERRIAAILDCVTISSITSFINFVFSYILTDIILLLISIFPRRLLTNIKLLTKLLTDICKYCSVVELKYCRVFAVRLVYSVYYPHTLTLQDQRNPTSCNTTFASTWLVKKTDDRPFCRNVILISIIIHFILTHKNRINYMLMGRLLCFKNLNLRTSLQTNYHGQMKDKCGSTLC